HFFTHTGRLVPLLFPYTTLFRSQGHPADAGGVTSVRGRRLRRRDVLRVEERRRGTRRRRLEEQLFLHPVRVRRRLQRAARPGHRSEEHTSELQSRENLVCRLLLE